MISHQQYLDLQPATRKMAGGLYEEGASLGALYEESDTYNYKSPQGGTATQTINVIGAVGRGPVTVSYTHLTLPTKA